MQLIVEKRGYRLLPLLALGLAVALLGLLVLNTEAVHNDGLLELDGNTVFDGGCGPDIPAGGSSACVDNNITTPATFDWQDDNPGDAIARGVCQPTNTTTDRTITEASPLPDNIDVATCIDDWELPDHTYFASNKDIEDIAPESVDTWACVEQNNVLEKDEIMNSYAAKATVPAGPAAGHQALYFGFERPSNNGTSFMGFWFLQGAAGCEHTGTGQESFASNGSGPHTEGDILVLSDFTGGGTLSQIRVVQWKSGVSTGDPCATPQGGLAVATNLCPFASVATSDCRLQANPNDDLCGRVNAASITTPWWNQPKAPPCSPNKGGVNAAPGTTAPCTVPLPFNTFFEAGIDLDALFCPVSASPTPTPTTPAPCEIPCFSTFLAETRSSAEFSATLKDFARGEFFTCGSKSGVKFLDTNANGVKDSGESGLSGWTINLYRDLDGDGVLDAGETTPKASAVTDSDGAYIFTDLQPGQYIVCEKVSDQDPDYRQSLPVSGSPPTPPATGPADCTADSNLGDVGYAFTIQSLEEETGNDFGNYLPASKSGEKFIDLDADGQPKEAGEDCSNFASPNNNNGGCQGVTIHLFGTDGMGNAVHLHTTTDAGGEYSFTGLNPGSYTVCEEAPSAFTQSFPTSGADCSGHAAVAGGTVGAKGYAITLTSDEDETGNDFGNYRPATKAGVKFNDLNGNGVKNAGEPGINGVEIHLFGTSGAGTSVHLHTTTANIGGVDGSYSFTVSPGNYTVCETIPTGFVQTFPTAGPGIVSCAGHSGGGGGTAGGLGYSITLTSGQLDDDNHFGNHQGSLIIRKEAKNANTACPAGTPSDPGCHDLQPGSPQTFRVSPNPLPGAPGPGGAAFLDVTDNDANDAFSTVGVICLDQVIIGPSYSVKETAAPANYKIPTPDTQSGISASSSSCGGRAPTVPSQNTVGLYDVLFVNMPLSEIEVIFRSLAGDGITQLTTPIVCDSIADTDADSPGPTFNDPVLDRDEVFTNLDPGTYNCTIVIDP